MPTFHVGERGPWALLCCMDFIVHGWIFGQIDVFEKLTPVRSTESSEGQISGLQHQRLIFGKWPTTPGGQLPSPQQYNKAISKPSTCGTTGRHLTNSMNRLICAASPHAAEVGAPRGVRREELQKVVRWGATYEIRGNNGTWHTGPGCRWRCGTRDRACESRVPHEGNAQGRGRHEAVPNGEARERGVSSLGMSRDFKLQLGIPALWFATGLLQLVLESYLERTIAKTGSTPFPPLASAHHISSEHNIGNSKVAAIPGPQSSRAYPGQMWAQNPVWTGGNLVDAPPAGVRLVNEAGNTTRFKRTGGLGCSHGTLSESEDGEREEGGGEKADEHFASGGVLNSGLDILW
ncbi:hypothetical protein B0H17DRAFT_1130128 [Mycena rosella]|uniref:Uncharacterized protein n=1 Tax=Mycena rosella TaxID=1033263 RepID=A0AAD7DR76_MYCRO|nr:hypothetical protein B0H17DRAFT_1130128 [Mycena rosella]